MINDDEHPFKGWTQTWLVHMRAPLRLKREIGCGSFAVAQILFAGLLISALLHPLLIASAIFLVADLVFLDAGTGYSLMLAVDTANISLGYLSFLVLGWTSLSRKERRRFAHVALFTPFYWLMISLAAWRAVWQLFRDPFRWEKTPHRPSDEIRGTGS
ncbi:hypothetical protein SAMN04488498_11392 [Mesorhizobium albiziae]|uniref:Uncharacterized protein n=2 Tax=Neomesorhizobium albiziae TaxID=335020 RepID=A0A1I4CLJ9_9HYPH|nr:hypothetical protein GCM10007937_09970 [Mesorhizobium albiziae]SFK81109.1 hypothetical protein SAMN04488498_11392 [Mesorhizobium albiziae]